jgi:hypothetical protein
MMPPRRPFALKRMLWGAVHRTKQLPGTGKTRALGGVRAGEHSTSGAVSPAGACYLIGFVLAGRVHSNARSRAGDHMHSESVMHSGYPHSWTSIFILYTSWSENSLLYTQFFRTHPSSISSSIHSIRRGTHLSLYLNISMCDLVLKDLLRQI